MIDPIDSGFPDRRRASVIALTGVCLFTLLLCAALAVDVGYICALTCEQQNNADAGALAGGVALQEEDSLSVVDRVRAVLALNQQPQGYLSLDDQIIEIGGWDSIGHIFTPMDQALWEENAYAVRVRAARNNAELFFAPLMNINTTDVSREAVVVGSRPCGGVWGLQGVRIPGNVYTDSYDSSTETYSAGTAGDDGDVCSGRGVRVMGSFDINGDIMTGLGYEVDISGSAGTITGITTSTLSGMDSFDIDLSAMGSLINEGALNVNGQSNIDLAPGDHLFDSITLRAGATVTLSGPTTIYVLGNVDATGDGFINTSQDPAELTLIVLGDRVLLNGAYDFYGTVIAPYADVILSGTSDYYGIVIGQTVEMRGDFQFHVDTSLPAYDLIKPPPPMLVR